jgi:hypothetical protein
LLERDDDGGSDGSGGKLGKGGYEGSAIKRGLSAEMVMEDLRG